MPLFINGPIKLYGDRDYSHDYNGQIVYLTDTQNEIEKISFGYSDSIARNIFKGKVFYDQNLKMELFDGPDTALKDVPVKMQFRTFNFEDLIAITTTTDENGNYQFDIDVPFGVENHEVVVEDIPGYQHSQAIVGSPSYIATDDSSDFIPAHPNSFIFQLFPSQGSALVMENWNFALTTRQDTSNMSLLPAAKQYEDELPMHRLRAR